MIKGERKTKSEKNGKGEKQKTAETRQRNNGAAGTLVIKKRDLHLSSRRRGTNTRSMRTGAPFMSRRKFHLNGEASLKTSRRQRTTRFERFAAEGNRFIRDVGRELGVENQLQALRITRAVLHAVRDRIMPDDAVEFAQGLPTLIKAIYFEEYDLSDTPVVIRSRERFIDFIRHKNPVAARRDFPDDGTVVAALQAVFRVLERRMDIGQIHHLKSLLNEEICHMIDAIPGAYRNDR